MVYCAMCDPGQLKREDQRNAYMTLQGASGSAEIPEELPLPRRCHKTWLYALPIRRYDHYCRWLTNCIGLMNHREFVVMCTGLVLIGSLGSIVDVCLVVVVARR